MSTRAAKQVVRRRQQAHARAMVRYLELQARTTPGAQASPPADHLVVRTMRRAREHPRVVRLRHFEKTIGGHVVEVTEDDVGVVELHER